MQEAGCGKNHFDEFAHRSVSSLGSGDELALLADRRLRICGSGCKPCNLKRRQIVHVVTHEADFLERKIVKGCDIPQGTGLVLAGLFNIADLHLRRQAIDQRTVLAGDQVRASVPLFALATAP